MGFPETTNYEYVVVIDMHYAILSSLDPLELLLFVYQIDVFQEYFILVVCEL